MRNCFKAIFLNFNSCPFAGVLPFVYGSPNLTRRTPFGENENEIIPQNGKPLTSKVDQYVNEWIRNTIGLHEVEHPNKTKNNSTMPLVTKKQ
ncbi:hypothetical protein CEXT_373391 [Caerostris extrusa]|uniref:Uncharacterized protein n=1 Tax=Caerostris extrusa TaxID=172846 RepID=A0AAV4S7H8_CAEEX|nr:hypothetical protein CEXT_373391 [Caerostris extrusa]